MKDDALGMLLLGGGVSALVWVATRSRPRSSSTIEAKPADVPAGTWVFPVPTLGDRPAVVSNPFKASAHLGVDIMFKRRDARDLIAAFPAGTSNGTPLFFIPDNVPAFAASAGTVTFAANTPVGHTVIIKHPNDWSTYYTHLSTLVVAKGQQVTAGQSLGTIGASPTDGQHLVHLHFEMWKGHRRSGAVDPAPFLAAWSRTSMPWAPPSTTLVASTHRNGTLSAYRPVGDRGEPYPDWIRALKDEAGVYVIRDAESREILYVGSSSGRLYDTLTRHLQTVRHEAQEAPMT